MDTQVDTCLQGCSLPDGAGGQKSATTRFWESWLANPKSTFESRLQFFSLLDRLDRPTSAAQA
jgi:hypothetical protein